MRVSVVSKIFPVVFNFCGTDTKIVWSDVLIGKQIERYEDQDVSGSVAQRVKMREYILDSVMVTW